MMISIPVANIVAINNIHNNNMARRRLIGAGSAPPDPDDKPSLWTRIKRFLGVFDE